MLQALKGGLINAVILITICLFSNSLGAQDTLSLIDPPWDKTSSDNDSVFSFESNGDRIFYRKWGPPAIENNRKILLVLHGIGFHSSPYGKISKYIENDSVLVYAIDMPGHGLSGNPRGVIGSNENILASIDSLILLIDGENKYADIYLMGVSMGSVYALASAMNDSTASYLSGLILIGSPLRVHRSQIVHFDNFSCIFPLLFNRGKPFLYLDGRRLESSVTDQKYIDARRNDSLSIHYVSMDYLLKVRKIQRECKRKSALAGISLPVLIIHGGNDKVSSIRGAYFLNRNLVNSRRQLLIYPNSRHSVFWDTDSVKVIRDLVKWISDI